MQCLFIIKSPNNINKHTPIYIVPQAQEPMVQ